MQQRTGVPTPRFYITNREPLRPGAILLATVAAVVALASVLYALAHNGNVHLSSGARPGSAASKAAPDADDKDDKGRPIPDRHHRSWAIPPTLLYPRDQATTSAPFTPRSSFACLASAMRQA